MGTKKLGAHLILALRSAKVVSDVILITGIGAMLALFGLQFPHAPNLDSLWLVKTLHAWADPPLGQIASVAGWAWPSMEISLLPIGLGFALLLAKQGIDAWAEWLSRLVPKRFPLPEDAHALSDDSSSEGISVSTTTLTLAAVSEKARARIQRRHARVAHLLREAKHRHCAFLSLDVVDADQMKQGAPAEEVTRSFRAYDEMLEEVFQLTHAWKEAWTPDGVMVCYLNTNDALEAAQRVLQGVKVLNAGRNQLPQPFRVRCGLNEGEVVIFEDSKLEKVADHVIDVAGHMQKKAHPNSLWVGSDVYEHLPEKTGFLPTNLKVDGFAVFEWRA